MNSLWIFFIPVFAAFCLGYGLRRINLSWESKATSAELDAALQAEQLAATVSASLDGIIIINSDGLVVDFSDSAERIFGYRKQDIVGKNMAELIVPERYRDAHNAGMARMRDTGKANILGQRIEIEALRENGEEFMSELAISRSRGESGEIFIAYIRDISEAKAAENALREAKDAAELANKAKTQFISAMSHEIRTPFNAVLGILDILGDTDLNTDQKQLIQTAEKTSKSLLRIINDVLDYARISSGSVKVVKEPFFAPDIFDDVYKLFAMHARDHNIDLVMNTKNASPVYLSGDAGRIRQILMNFVSNAIKYTRDGDVELIVETIESSAGRWRLKCQVKDTGNGISEEQISHLFDEFYMVDEVDTRASEGTGLGLTICKVLTKMMRGKIGVESEVGKGSNFWVTIPLKEAPAPRQAQDNPTTSEDIEGKQVLLAEDNPTNRMVVSRILEKRGVIITQAVNGIEALASLETQQFDLLLTDVFMPEMGGKELVQRMRDGSTSNAKIPVIALTAMGDMHEAEELKSYGVDQVILKPFNSKDLITAIAEQCASDKEPLQPATKKTKMKLSGGLIDGLDPEDLIAIKNQFKIDLEDVTASLKTAINNEDVKGSKFASHTMKGLAGLYGFSELSELAALTNSHSLDATLSKMVEYGSRAIKLAEASLLELDDLFGVNEEAA